MTDNAYFGKIGNWLKSLDNIKTQLGNGAESLYYHEWAERPVMLSEAFYAETLPESGNFTDGHIVIQDLMRELDSMFIHEFGALNHDYLEDKGFRQYVLDRIKDPGILHHLVFWDFGKDPSAVTFEWHHFRGENKFCLEMLNGQNYDIFGRPCLTNAVQRPWDHLVTLYHDQIENPHDNGYGQKLFGEVLGWPLS